MIAALAAATVFALSPYPVPDPDIEPGQILAPSYITNGDGTRWQCAPGGFSCVPDTSGLPSYLTPS